MCKALLAFVLCVACLTALSAQQQTDTLVVYFGIDKSIVDDSNAEPLDKLISCESVASISVYGYTDFLGSRAHNRQLSEKRSANVYNYLITNGIDREYIVVCKGEGIHPGSAEENRPDISDKGIKEHRIVLVVYTTNLQDTGLSEKNDETVEDNDFPTKDNDFLTEGNDFQNGENDMSTEDDHTPLEDETTVITELTEENLVADNVIVMERIFFQYNTYEFSYMAYPALFELLTTMQNYNSLKLEIHGHICCFNNEFRNDVITVDGMLLSVGRAKAVHDFLVDNGIDPTRLSYKGFGNTRRRYPLEQNEYERAMNRRVEILIVER